MCACDEVKAIGCGYERQTLTHIPFEKFDVDKSVSRVNVTLRQCDCVVFFASLLLLYVCVGNLVPFHGGQIQRFRFFQNGTVIN